MVIKLTVTVDEFVEIRSALRLNIGTMRDNCAKYLEFRGRLEKDILIAKEAYRKIGEQSNQLENVVE